MAFRAIIFDLDGTLVNSIGDICESMNLVLHNHNLQTHETDSYKQWIGDGLKTLVFMALPEKEKNSELFPQYVKEMKDIYSTRWMLKTRVYPEIKLLLDELIPKRLKLAVLSNKPDRHTKVIGQELLSEWKFQIILGMRDGIPRKPDPASAIEISQSLKISPENFLYLGDSGIDMETANAAGMFAVGATWGYKSKEDIMKGGAKVIINKPLELLDLLK